MPSGSSIQVQRFTGASRLLLPLPQEIAALNNFSTYTDFTAQVEDYHNDVHSWVGGQTSSGQLGTMSDIMISPADPIFWMHHAQCDRLWTKWQTNHSGKPTLTGTKKTLDPWSETSDGVNSIATLHYSYA
jgi:tyrosinase